MHDLRRYVTAFLSIAVLAIAARADEVRITVDKLPKAVVDAVKAKFPDAKLTGAEKETQGDKVFYEVEFKTKGKSAEMLLTPEGKVVSIEKEVEAKDLPKAVSAALNARFPKATVKKVEEETKNQAVTYQVVLETAKKRTAVLALDSSGKVLATQQEIDVKDLPKAVMDGLASKHPKSSVTKAVENKRGDKVLYQVRLAAADKKVFRVLVDAKGKVLKEAEIKAKK